MSDRELFAAIARGDKQAFTVFYKRWVNGVRRIALHILHDEEEARDAAQRVFMKIHRAATTYRGAAEPNTVLYEIAKHEAIDILRSRVARDHRHAEGGAAWCTPPARPDELIEASRLANDIDAAIAPLDPKIRRTHELSAHGFRNREIARMLGVPRGTVGWRLSYSRRAIRRHLTRSTSPTSPRRPRRGVFYV